MDSHTFMLYSLAVIQAYLLGAIPFGFLLVRFLKGIDIRTEGSGNIGATNVGRVAGARLGILAFLLDLGKGTLSATLVPFAVFVIVRGSYQADGAGDILRGIFAAKGLTDLRIFCGLGAVAGHVWTIFLGFKGGKGVATSLGVMLGLAPWPTMVALFVWAVVTSVSGYVSLGSITSAAVLPVAFIAFSQGDLRSEWHLLALVIAVAVIVILRHRGNIKRLIAGTESRFNFHRKRRPRSPT